ncbi:MAG: molybdopterin-dependent oxidoreductase [Epsilonproteobacteria bacterium]|nr:molybdopterin-dependent oxidoreductase [Campylobacterota bacterium]
MATIDTVCTYCGVGCEITANIENGLITKVFAKKESEVSQGKLCIKGSYGWEYLFHPNRLQNALVKKEFVKKNSSLFENLKEFDKEHYSLSYENAYRAIALKLQEILKTSSPSSIASIGGARTSCESAYIFQKFTREVLGSPNVDNCARVCHSPSLKGMRATIGEGAATNPFSDISKAQNLLVIGSDMLSAHPIVGNKVLKALKKEVSLHTIDVRETQLSRYSCNHLTIPFESNLLILNMMARVILENGWENKEFIAKRTQGFQEFKEKILNDPLTKPSLFKKITGYEELEEKIEKVAYALSHKKSLILWGLGVTEHLDGSYAVMALVNLALLTGNVGKRGAGLIPLRGQNNVQGACDMGMLPYYLPDYKTPKTQGLMTPDIVEAILNNKVKAVLNMGEDLAHIHPNQTKIHQALRKLELLVVNEIFPNEITKYAHFILGVKSGYEKEGVFINAERRLHLSQPLINSSLPDDWEVWVGISKFFKNSLHFSSSKEVWEEVREVAKERFEGASYDKLKKNQLRGLQWPIKEKDTPILHQVRFNTPNGLGKFIYHPYHLRGMVKELLEKQKRKFYLTTGRTLAHYNNSAQTQRCNKLQNRYQEDILLVSEADREFFKKEKVKLKSKYGESGFLRVKFTNRLKPKTLYTTFHFAKSKVNFLFGDESDNFVKTAKFKSVEVEIIQ